MRKLLKTVENYVLMSTLSSRNVVGPMTPKPSVGGSLGPGQIAKASPQSTVNRFCIGLNWWAVCVCMHLCAHV
ncbi:unnamed protein product [Protopolystoma xenopodis]|uniref:Uncharacterized protein n=1 Tax=Protopolystoma xenopodis TaxID=117903 RepID=A0A3S4ZX98_9PLAT|nr:unnamed protein product [Protopolystoma xenopodis]